MAGLESRARRSSSTRSLAGQGPVSRGVDSVKAPKVIASARRRHRPGGGRQAFRSPSRAAARLATPLGSIDSWRGTSHVEVGWAASNGVARAAAKRTGHSRKHPVVTRGRPPTQIRPRASAVVAEEVGAGVAGVSAPRRSRSAARRPPRRTIGLEVGISPRAWPHNGARGHSRGIEGWEGGSMVFDGELVVACDRREVASGRADSKGSSRPSRSCSRILDAALDDEQVGQPTRAPGRAHRGERAAQQPDGIGSRSSASAHRPHKVSSPQ